jgi:hypothetical protein
MWTTGHWHVGGRRALGIGVRQRLAQLFRPTFIVEADAKSAGDGTGEAARPRYRRAPAEGCHRPDVL